MDEFTLANKLKLNLDKTEILLVQKALMWMFDHHHALNRVVHAPPKGEGLQFGCPLG